MRKRNILVLYPIELQGRATPARLELATSRVQGEVSVFLQCGLVLSERLELSLI